LALVVAFSYFESGLDAMAVLPGGSTSSPKVLPPNEELLST